MPWAFALPYSRDILLSYEKKFNQGNCLLRAVNISLTMAKAPSTSQRASSSLSTRYVLRSALISRIMYSPDRSDRCAALYSLGIYAIAMAGVPGCSQVYSIYSCSTYLN